MQRPPTSMPPIVSPAANRALARRAGDGMAFDAVPRWLLSALRMPFSLPVIIEYNEVDTHPLRSLAWVAHDMIECRAPLQNFLIEMETPDDEPIMVLVDGTIEGDRSNPHVHIMLRDVTNIVQERRRAAMIGNYHGLVGKSLRMLEVYHRIALYGPTKAAVLITGETGTGKELVARALHDRSERVEGPFVPVNCTALTPDLFESELFGHEKGSFTGAVRTHRGRFERADGGTLFLDELGDMPLVTQAKLLRALEEGVIEKVGAETEEEVDVRTIAATNVALEHAVAGGRFRADLYHRLSVFRIHIPPLRERVGDLPLLVDYYIEIFNKRYDRHVKLLTPEAMRLLEDYPWPGNVRELRNVLERLFVETTGEAIGAKALSGWIEERDYLMPGAWNTEALYGQPRTPIVPQARPQEYSVPARPQAASPPPDRPTPERPLLPSSTLENWSTPFTSQPPLSLPEDRIEIPEEDESPELTEKSIREAYRKNKGNLTGAARSLGVHKATLYRHMKRLALTREDLEEESA